MLSRITIKNLVIVRALDLELHPGMTALTGETGAGKSILIDALGLALGEKADNGMIREGADRAEVSVAFDLADDNAGHAWLDEHDLAAEGECLLRRVLVREGRSRAYVNGSPVPMARLRELGDLLVDIHGQHAHQSLLHARAQRTLLDDFGGLDEALQRTADGYRAWQALHARHAELAAASSDRVNRLDYLRFQIDELDDLALDPQAYAELAEEHARLAHAERLLADTGKALAVLEGEGDDAGSCAQQLLRRATAVIDGLATLDPALGETRDLLDSAGIQLDEACSGLRHYQDRVEIDPERLQQIDGQLARLHEVGRKHHVKPEQLGPVLQALRDETTSLENADDELTGLAGQVAKAKADYAAAALALSKARREAADRLGAIVTDSMQGLGMRGGRFSVECVNDPDKPGADGTDRVRFLVAANPGQSMAPLSDVASGGELSRISLAIQVATVDCGSVPTLIFDEVDVGIGGAVAEIVGQLLRRLGKERQVLCVTHLPQVASQAHRHCRVHKMSDGRTTETRIDGLDASARIDEIARMLGGIDITEQTRRHADEMIRRAQRAS